MKNGLHKTCLSAGNIDALFQCVYYVHSHSGAHFTIAHDQDQYEHPDMLIEMRLPAVH